MKATEAKLKKLSEQKEKLETELNNLMRERNEFILECLTALPTERISTEILIGSLLDTIDICNTPEDSSENPNSSQQQKEAWKKSGEKFCRKLSAKVSAKPNQKKQQAAA